jgi:hypothetical protein
MRTSGKRDSIRFIALLALARAYQVVGDDRREFAAREEMLQVTRMRQGKDRANDMVWARSADAERLSAVSGLDRSRCLVAVRSSAGRRQVEAEGMSAHRAAAT